MSLIYFRNTDEPSDEPVSDQHPFPIKMVDKTIPYSEPKFYSALSTTLQLVKGGRALLDVFEASNINAADAFVQMFDAASAGDVTLGTTTPTWSLFVPKGDATSRGAADKTLPMPVSFLYGLVIAATTTATGSSAPTTGLVVNLAVR